MKLATYNIWNSSRGFPMREAHMIEQLQKIDADICFLQEVSSDALAQKIQESLGYPYGCFESHIGRVIEVEPWKGTEGLAILSRYPIESVEMMEYAQIVTLSMNHKQITCIHVHLPWDSVIAQEQTIIKLIRKVESIPSDYQLIVGDFNCGESSSVHHFLKGYRSLNHAEVNRYWTDLAEVAQEFLNRKKRPTLDLSHNPRWKHNVVTDISARVDCIFLKDSFPNEYLRLADFQMFGEEIYDSTQLCASDHYGIWVELEFPT